MKWLEKEMDFFTTNKAIHMPGWKSRLFRFHVVATGPRPESFREDLECAEHIEDGTFACNAWRYSLPF